MEKIIQIAQFYLMYNFYRKITVYITIQLKLRSLFSIKVFPKN